MVGPVKLAPEIMTKVASPTVPNEGDAEVPTGTGADVAAPAIGTPDASTPTLSAL